MGTISFRNIRKSYPDDVIAVQDFNLDLSDGEFVVLVGPSGCGKSTVLRMLAGLEDISSGELWINGQLANRIPPAQRDIAMVFQNYALYPHMTIYQNMALPLELRGMDRRDIRRRINETAAILDIQYLLNRKPRALSGGQRQRAALGRALVRKPSVFLLDEPLSNLDAKLRTQMRSELLRLHRSLDTTFVYVTHDQTEAMTMGDRIVVMRDALIQQVDRPQMLYEHPVNQFVAGFIGAPPMNFFTSPLAHADGGFYVFLEQTRITLPAKDTSFLTPYIGSPINVGFRPEAAYCGAKRSRFDPTLSGRLTLIEHLGADDLLHVLCGDMEFILQFAERQAFYNGDRITFHLDAQQLHLFSCNSGLSLLPYMPSERI